jgi:hypothetical protein
MCRHGSSWTSLFTDAAGNAATYSPKSALRRSMMVLTPKIHHGLCDPDSRVFVCTQWLRAQAMPLPTVRSASGYELRGLELQ